MSSLLIPPLLTCTLPCLQLYHCPWAMTKWRLGFSMLKTFPQAHSHRSAQNKATRTPPLSSPCTHSSTTQSHWWAPQRKAAAGAIPTTASESAQCCVNSLLMTVPFVRSTNHQEWRITQHHLHCLNPSHSFAFTLSTPPQSSCRTPSPLWFKCCYF